MIALWLSGQLVSKMFQRFDTNTGEFDNGGRGKSSSMNARAIRQKNTPCTNSRPDSIPANITPESSTIYGGREQEKKKGLQEISGRN